MTILQLNPPLWLETPKGQGLAHFVIDPGVEHDLQWVCFINETGEVWTFANPEVQAAKNRTLDCKRSKDMPLTQEELYRQANEIMGELPFKSGDLKPTWKMFSKGKPLKSRLLVKLGAKRKNASKSRSSGRRAGN